MTTLIDLLNNQTRTLGTKVAFRYGTGDEPKQMTWAQYGNDIAAIALALDSRGIGRGSSVAILANGSVPYFVVDLASCVLGSKSASIYPTNTPEQIQYVLENSDSTIIFADSDAQIAKIRAMSADAPQVTVVAFAGSGADLTYEELLAQGRALVESRPQRYEELCAALTPADPGCIIYTSGTTGAPKGAVLSQGALVTEMTGLQAAVPQPGEYRVLSYLPMAHIAERLLSIYGMLVYGGEIWFGTVDTLRADLAKARPTRFLGVPRVWEKFEEALKTKIPDSHSLPPETVAGVLKTLGLENVTTAFSGAAPIATTTLDYFAGFGIEILEAYGMTETCGVTTVNRPGESKIGTVGQTLPGVDHKIADDGEILSRGTGFTEYLKNPDATAEALRGGWVHSGDLGTLDDEGYLTITGRKKDLIITAGGENIAPGNIQLLLTGSHYISQAIVIGDRRKFVSALLTISEEAITPWAQDHGLGELSMSELVKSEQVRDLIDAEVAEANTKLARVSRIREYRILPRDLSIESGELTPTMKVKRTVVEANFSDTIEDIYS